MKFKYSYVISVAVAFLAGVGLASLIIDQLKVIETINQFRGSQTFWTAAGAIATFLAVLTSLYIAHSGVKKERITRHREYWGKHYEHANTAYLYLTRLRNFSVIPGKNNSLFEEERFKEIYEGWNYFYTNENMTGALTKISNWKDENIHEHVEIVLLSFTLNFKGKQALDASQRKGCWESLNILMTICAEIAYQYLHECRRKAERLESTSDEDKNRGTDADVITSKANALKQLGEFKKVASQKKQGIG